MFHHVLKCHLILGLVLTACGGEMGDTTVEESSSELSIGIAPSIPPLTQIRRDIRATGSLRIIQPANGGQQTLQIEVKNVGNGSVTWPTNAGSVRVRHRTVKATLYPYFKYWDRTSAGGNRLQPGQLGYLKVKLPGNYVKFCHRPRITIDVYRQRQSPASSFDNDKKTAKAPCLGFRTKIEKRTLNETPSSYLKGKTIEQILNSKVSGRPDGKRCKSCHYYGGPNPYQPFNYVDWNTEVTGATWKEYWAWKFLTNTQPSGKKPYGLKKVIRMWAKSGYRK